MRDRAKEFWFGLSRFTRGVVLAGAVLAPTFALLDWDGLWREPGYDSSEVQKDAAKLVSLERKLLGYGLVFRREGGTGRSAQFRVDPKRVERYFQANPSSTLYDLIYALEQFASFSEAFLRKYGKPFRTESQRAPGTYTEVVGADAIRAKMEAAREQGRSYRDWIQLF